jgi:transposase
VASGSEHLAKTRLRCWKYVRASFKVIRHVRPKLSCQDCERILQAPAPSWPIDRGLAGPSLLAHVLVSKYADHQPLYRQSETYGREGVDLDRSTLAGWVGASSDLLAPLVGCGPQACPVRWQAPRERHASSGACARHRQDKDRQALDLCSR